MAYHFGFEQNIELQRREFFPRGDRVPCTRLPWGFPYSLPPCQGGTSLGRHGAGAGLRPREGAPHVPAFSTISLFGKGGFSPMLGSIQKKKKKRFLPKEPGSCRGFEDRQFCLTEDRQSVLWHLILMPFKKCLQCFSHLAAFH